MTNTPKVPIPTLERLATYFRYLCELQAAEVETISSTEVERQTGVNAAQFRKDLSYFGEFGKPGVGYNVVELQARIARILKIDRDQSVVVFGAGNLGSALVGYPGHRQQRFDIAAVYDSDPARIGRELFDLPVKNIAEFREDNLAIRARIGILAVPADAAQSVADLAISGGIKALLNFAPVGIRVPHRVFVRNVSFLQELAVLSYHLSNDPHK